MRYSGRQRAGPRVVGLLRIISAIRPDSSSRTAYV